MGILESLETKFAVPAVPPEDFAAYVATLGSSTVPANRELSALLLQRLHGIAESHDGVVPIYGRLFAQWLHHAYPRECNYPHLSGTTSPKNPVDWKFAHQVSLTAPK